MARAEDLYSGKENKFIFQWTVVNLHMFGVLEGKELVSPKFTVPSLDNAEWYLKLVPNTENKSATCFLSRTGSGPESINISYASSVGSSYSMEVHTFEKNSCSVMPGIIYTSDFADKVDKSLTKDFLIECHLWPRDKDFFQTTNLYPVFCSTRTIIPCEERNFSFLVKHFSDCSIGLIKSSCIDSVGNGEPKLVCELRKVSFTTLGQKFHLKLLKPDPEHSTPLVIKYKIQLVDAFKKRHFLIGGRFGFNSNNHELSFLISMSMLEKKDLYIPGDVMLLFCEIAISDNNSASFFESTRYNSSEIQAINHISGWGVYLDHKYNEHRFLFRLLAVLVFIISLIIPHLFTDNSL